MKQRPRRWMLSASFGVAAFLAGSTNALANGVFPTVNQIVTEPGEPDHIVLRSTFGLVVSSDHGENWDWICESAAGYVDVLPPMTVLEGGRVVLGLLSGISLSSSNTCDFAMASGIEAKVIDVSRAASDAARVVALSVTETDSQVWESTDGGDNFVPLGEPLANFRAATLDVPATEPGWIYVSGYAVVTTGSGEGRLLRSEDHGETWQTFPVPESNSAKKPYIAAVDPERAGTVYVRTEGLPGRLFVTHDGGETLDEVLRLEVPVQGFALSPDGRQVLATNMYDGAFLADTDSLAFEKVACRGPSCLSWTEAGLFGCGDDASDGFVIGKSDDNGATFRRVVDLGCIRGPLECESSTLVGGECPFYWPTIQAQLGADECAPRDVPPYRGCFDDGNGGAAGDAGETAGSAGLPGVGEGGTGASEPSAGGAGNAAATGGGSALAGAPVAGAGTSDDGGCGLSPAKSRNNFGFLVMVGVVLGLIGKRATRRRVRPTSPRHELDDRSPPPRNPRLRRDR